MPNLKINSMRLFMPNDVDLITVCICMGIKTDLIIMIDLTFFLH